MRASAVSETDRVRGTVGRLLTITALAVSFEAFADPPDAWGLVANGAHFSCVDTLGAPVPACDGSTYTPLVVVPTEGNGGLNISPPPFSFANDRGTLNAGATFAGPLAAPRLTAAAASAPAGVVQGTATAIQGYTYTGAAPGTLTVSASLTGSVENPAANALTGISAAVALFPAVPGVSFELLTSQIALALFDPNAATLSASESGTFAVPLVETTRLDVAPGDGFYLVATLAATAGGTGASASSANSLRTEFVVADPGDPDPAATLVPAAKASTGGRRAVPALPIPATAALFAGLLLSAVARFQRRSSAGGR